MVWCMMPTKKSGRYSHSTTTHSAEDAPYASRTMCKRTTKMKIIIWDSLTGLIYAESTSASTDITWSAYIATGSWPELSRKTSSDAKSCTRCPRRRDVQLAEDRLLPRRSLIFRINTRSIRKSMIKLIEKPNSCWQVPWEDTGALKSSELGDSHCPGTALTSHPEECTFNSPAFQISANHFIIYTYSEFTTLRQVWSMRWSLLLIFHFTTR